MSRRLVGMDEMAAFLAVSPATAERLVRSPGFPRPTAEVAGGPVWASGDLERWREERLVRPGGARPTKSDYLLRLEAVEQWPDGDERFVARILAEARPTTMVVERSLPSGVGDRIVAELKPLVGQAAAVRAFRRGLAQEAAAAVGRELEQLGDLGALPAVGELGPAHQRRVMAAARRAARLRLPAATPGEVLRVGRER
jgi:predicted DNA-binding transcriptional regulator AlpA